jgi:hypothetical protein
MPSARWRRALDIQERRRKREEQTGRTIGRVKHDGEGTGVRVLEEKCKAKSYWIAARCGSGERKSQMGYCLGKSQRQEWAASGRRGREGKGNKHADRMPSTSTRSPVNALEQGTPPATGVTRNAKR